MNPTTTAAFRARDQLLALVMASHNRCGAMSPARHFASLPPLATSPLWDWCLRDSEIVFAVVMNSHPSNRRVYFTIGVSSSLMSVTRDLREPHTTACDAFQQPICVLIVGTRFIVRCLTGEGILSFIMHDLDAPLESRLLVTDDDPRNLFWGWDGNHMWWIHSSGRTLYVVKIGATDGDCGGGDVARGTAGFVRFDEAFPVGTWCHSVSFNRHRQDEALLAIRTRNDKRLILMVVDAHKSYTTRNLAMLRLTECKLPESPVLFESGITMRNSSGDCVLFVALRSAADSRQNVYEVKESSGEIVPISRVTTKLSQLSHCLFCVTRSGHDHSTEIWDCNNTTAPLRVLEPRFLVPVIAESGFLFHCHGSLNPSVDVTDATGLHVCTFNFGSPCNTSSKTVNCHVCTVFEPNGGAEAQGVPELFDALVRARVVSQLPGLGGKTPTRLTVTDPQFLPRAPPAQQPTTSTSTSTSSSSTAATDSDHVGCVAFQYDGSLVKAHNVWVNTESSVVVVVIVPNTHIKDSEYSWRNLLQNVRWGGSVPLILLNTCDKFTLSLGDQDEALFTGSFLMTADKVIKCSFNPSSLKALVHSISQVALNRQQPRQGLTVASLFPWPNTSGEAFQQEGSIDIDVKWMAPPSVRTMLQLFSVKADTVQKLALEAWVKAGNWPAVKEVLFSRNKFHVSCINLPSLSLDCIPGITCETLNLSDNSINAFPGWLPHARVDHVELIGNPLKGLPSRFRSKEWSMTKLFLLFGEIPVKLHHNQRIVKLHGTKSETSSPVIQVHKPFNLQKNDVPELSWTAWELGGSDEDWDPFYPCFFFTDSVFMLVFDGSFVSKKAAPAKLNFWLHQIDECHNSNRARASLCTVHTRAKVILAGFYPSEYLREEFKGLFTSINQYWKSRIDFRGLFAVRLADGSGYAWSEQNPEGSISFEIVQAISHALETTTTTATYYVPRSWVKLQGVLIARAKTEPFIPRWSLLVRTARECGVGRITGKRNQNNEQEEMGACFDWLSDVGSIFHFRQRYFAGKAGGAVPGSNNEIVVLQPSWFTEASSAMKNSVFSELSGFRSLKFEGDRAIWLDVLGKQHRSSFSLGTPPDVASWQFYEQVQFRAFHVCVLQFGFLPAEAFAAVMCSLCSIPHSTPRMLWRDGLTILKGFGDEEKSDTLFHMLMQRVVDKVTGDTKVIVAMETICSPEEEINWKNNLMTSALYLLSRTTRSLFENTSLEPLFPCPKCLIKSLRLTHSYISFKEIAEARLGRNQTTTAPLCPKHVQLGFAQLVPEDLLHPTPTSGSTITKISGLVPNVTRRDDGPTGEERARVTSYFRYYSFDDSEPDDELVKSLLTAEATTLSNVDHKNVTKFFGLNNKGTSLLGNSESDLPFCSTPHLLPSKFNTFNTQQVVSLADLLKVLCVDPTDEKFRQGALLEEVLPMHLRERILTDVAWGLKHLHDQYPPIIHGDVHIGNVLITSLDPAVSDPLAKITLGKIPGAHGESGAADTPESVLHGRTIFSTEGDVWDFGILVHNVVGPRSFVALKSAPSCKTHPAQTANKSRPRKKSIPSGQSAATKPVPKVKLGSRRRHPELFERFQVGSALARGTFVVDIDNCATTTSPQTPQSSSSFTAPRVLVGTNTKNRTHTTTATATRYPLPLWARQVISLCLVADPLNRPSITSLLRAWGYFTTQQHATSSIVSVCGYYVSINYLACEEFPATRMGGVEGHIQIRRPSNLIDVSQ
ncbi:hypothetical protein Pelo_8990 [Pelomyxa schiedti]|nr:hypothetical protein Pelo_8990 [Pelomyxa schiedti]